LAALRANPALAFDPGIAELSSAPAVAGVDESLIRQLGALIGPQDPPFVLVVDDLHEITDPDALKSVESLLRLRPAGLALVLSARYQPGIALHRLRLEASVREIGPEDFALGREEAGELLASLGHDLEAEHVDALWRRTEGWVAGLRLAASELRRGGDPRNVARTFGGATPMVAELLVAEVLDHLPSDAREFLVATGACRELTPTLAERLTGRKDAGAVLEELHQRNALTQRLAQPDGSEPAYRYHDLLRDFLSTELQRTDLPRWRQLQGELATWYADQRQWRLALEHAVGSAEQHRVHAVLRHAGVGMILDGDGPLIERLLADVPDAWRADAVIGALLAAAALARFDPVTTDRHLAALDATPPSGSAPAADPWLSALRATVALHRARFGPEVSAALHDADGAGVGDTGDVDLDLLGLIQTGVARVRGGSPAGSRRDLEQALYLATSTSRDFPRVMCLGNLAALATIAGRVPECDGYLETALEIARLRGWDGSQLTAQLHVLVAWWALVRGDQSTARRELDSVPEPATLGNPDMRVASVTVMAVVDHFDGAPARSTAIRLRAAWEHLGDVETTPEMACMLIPWEVKLWLAADDPVAAEEAACRREADLHGTAEELLVRVLLARAKGFPATKARRWLAPACAGDVPVRFTVNRIWVWLLEAQLAAEADATQASHEALMQAVRSAAPDHLVGLVDAFGPATSELLAANRGRFGRHEPFVTELLERHSTEAVSAAATTLTPVEEAILRELPAHRTMADIAELRGVSVNTVKTHLKSIYRKLAVQGRREAVEAAREQGLL
ncbi:MAG: LuxR C-terminal-related transcriptional regulator, partial [Nitriliruptoraceae bacterium]